MNNPLAQKAQYYLNESHRLNEELKTEQEYSDLLENVLFELLGEEDFTKLFEVAILQPKWGENPISPERQGRRERRIKQIETIGRERAKQGLSVDRAAHSLVAKGADAPSAPRPPLRPGLSYAHPPSAVSNVRNALKTDKPLYRSENQQPESTELGNTMHGGGVHPSYLHPDRVRAHSDEQQKKIGRLDNAFSRPIYRSRNPPRTPKTD